MVTYTAAALNSRLNAVVTLIDAQASDGTLDVLDASSNVLASFTLQKPSATVAAGVLSFSGLPITSVAALTGTPASAVVDDGSGNLILTLAAGEFTVSPSPISSGENISLASAVIAGR